MAGERTRIVHVPCPVCREETLNADRYCGDGCRAAARTANDMLAQGLITSSLYPDPDAPPQYPTPDDTR